MAVFKNSRWMSWTILLIALIGLYSATYSFRDITDSDLNSLQTRALALHGDVDLSRYHQQLDPRALWVSWHGGRYSIYGVGVSLPAVPIYAVLGRVGASERVLQAAASIPFVAASVVVLFSLLLRLFGRRAAVAGACAFAFGTTMWPVAAMGFFQNAGTTLFQTIGLAGLFSRRKIGPAIAGLGFAGATLVRPLAAVALAFTGLFYLTKGWRTVIRYASGAALPLVVIVLQNRWIWGGWLTGGYSHSTAGFRGHLGHAMWALSFGWWRGMFAYSPFLIIGIFGLLIALRRRHEFLESRLVLCGSIVFATLLLYAKFTTWYGGLSQFGYRYQLDAVPFLIVLCVYALVRSERVRPLAGLFLTLSVLTMVAGAAPNDYGFDHKLFATRFVDSSIGQAWLVAVKDLTASALRLGAVVLVTFLFWATSRHVVRSNVAAGLESSRGDDP